MESGPSFLVMLWGDNRLGCAMNVNTCLYIETPNNVKGLLGTPNGVKDNDKFEKYNECPKVYDPIAKRTA